MLVTCALTEKEEGLLQYSPFIQLSPFTAVTNNYTVAYLTASSGASTRRPSVKIHSIPVKLESSSLVFCHGAGADFFIGRVLPSQGFDTLSSDFNFGLLILILCGLGAGVLMLKRITLKKQLDSQWQ